MSRGLFFIGAVLLAIWFLTDRFAIRHVYASPAVAVPITDVPKATTHRKLRIRSTSHIAQVAFSEVPEGFGKNITTVTVPVPAPTDAEMIEMLNDGIKPGLDRSQLRERLGNPVLEAETVEQSGLFETYVFQHKPDGPVALAYLKDGRVVENLRSWR